MQVLLLTQVLPYPPDSGPKVKTWNLLKYFAARCEMPLVFFRRDDRYSTRKRFLLLAKHRAPVVATFVAWHQAMRTLASWTIRPQRRCIRNRRNAMWRGMRDFLRRRWGARPA